MYGENFVICDRERQYAGNLLQVLSETHQAGIQWYLFYTLEELQKFAEQQRIHTLLIDGDYSKKQRDQIPADERFVLLKEKRQLSDGEIGVFRYQSAEAIWNQMEERKGERQSTVASIPMRVSGQLVGIYSPVHRIGKTRFALELGKRLAEKEHVLYLNLEEYAGGDVYFSEEQEQSLADLLYYCRQEKGNLGIRISTMVGQLGRLDYIAPMPYVQDLKAVRKEEWLELLDQIAEECIYSKILLDFGDSVDGLFDLLDRCDVIYTPYIEERIAMAKLAQYTETLRRSGWESILEKTVQKKITMRKGNRKELQTGKEREDSEEGKRRTII